MSENWYIKWKGVWPEEAIHVIFLRAGCGQGEAGRIMRVKLATSKNQWDYIKKAN